MNTPPSNLEVTQADREAAAHALGYKDVGDATDYRNTGAQDYAFAKLCGAFARHRIAHRVLSHQHDRPRKEATMTANKELVERVARAIYAATVDEANVRGVTEGWATTAFEDIEPDQQEFGRKMARAAVVELSSDLSSLERMREALERCAVIVERNLYRQHEKIEDVPKIARQALSPVAPESEG